LTLNKNYAIIITSGGGKELLPDVIKFIRRGTYMKYYSDVTKKFYDNANDCLTAERELIAKQEKEEYEKKRIAAERKAAADKVEAARKAMNEAQSAYKKELEAFCSKYGSYHYSTKDVSDIPTLFNDIFNIFH